MQDRVLIARTSQTTLHTRARALSIQTIAAGNATQDTTIKMASVSAAPTNPVGRTSSVRVRVTTRVAMATNATAVLQTARQASIAAAAAARVRARVGDAQISRTTPHTQARALST